jgi:hypothetical protein
LQGATLSHSCFRTPSRGDNCALEAESTIRFYRARIALAKALTVTRILMIQIASA